LEFLYAKKLKEGSFVIDSEELSRILKWDIDKVNNAVHYNLGKGIIVCKEVKGEIKGHLNYYISDITPEGIKWTKYTRKFE